MWSPAAAIVILIVHQSFHSTRKYPHDFLQPSCWSPYYPACYSRFPQVTPTCFFSVVYNYPDTCSIPLPTHLWLSADLHTCMKRLPEAWEPTSRRMNVIILSLDTGSRRRRKGKGQEKNSYRNRSKKFPNLMKTINLHIQEAQWTTTKGNMKKTTPRQTLIKLLKPMIGRKSKTSQREQDTFHTEA